MDRDAREMRSLSYQESRAAQPDSYRDARVAHRDARATQPDSYRDARVAAIEGASPKIQKIYLEEDDNAFSMEHTTRRSKRQNTADLTWPDRASDVTPIYEGTRRSRADERTRADERSLSDENVPSDVVSSSDALSSRDSVSSSDTVSTSDARRLRASTKRINYDSDNWDSYDPYGEDLSEEMSYHEERIARRAAKAASSSRGTAQARHASRASQADRSSRTPQAGRTSRASRAGRSSRTSQADRTARAAAAKSSAERQRQSSTERQSAAGQRRASAAKQSPQRRAAGNSSTRRAGRKINKKKLLPFAVGAALVIVAAVIAIIIIASGVKEATNLKLTATDTTQTISWERKGKEVGYEVLQKAPDGTFQIVKTVSAEGATSVTVEGLNSATLYEYKVRAVKGIDHPKKSAGVSIKGYTAPSVLTDITASTQVKDSLTFVWSDPQPVAGFELRYASSEDFHDATIITLTSENIVLDEGNGKNTYTLENQPEGTKYYYSMRSYCDQNSYSDWTPTAITRVTRPVDMRGIDVNAPMVAFTFDDGPDVSNITSRILDAFASAGGHATFFQLGQRAEMYPEKIQRIVNEGHEIANHTYDHSHLGDAVTSDDIIRANDAIEAAGGVRPVSFRSPGGNTTELIRQTCIQENMTLYYWSMDTRDWYTKDAAATVSYIKTHVEDGDIILMHNIYDSSAEAVEEILPWLVDQGYQLVTVSQLLVAKTGNLPEPGLEYYTATQTMDR